MIIVSASELLIVLFGGSILIGIVCAHLAQTKSRGSSAKNSPAPITTLSGLAQAYPTDAEVPQLLEVQL